MSATDTDITSLLARADELGQQHAELNGLEWRTDLLTFCTHVYLAGYRDALDKAREVYSA